MEKNSMSWLGFVNRAFFQWFFIRLTRHKESRIVEFDLESFSMMSDGKIAPRGRGIIKTYQWYSFQYWVKPLTGWNTDYIYVGKKSPKYLRITPNFK